MVLSNYRKFLTGSVQYTLQSGNGTKLLKQFLNIRESLFPLVEIIIFNFDSLVLYSNTLYFGNFEAVYGMCCRGEGRRRVGRKDCDGPFSSLLHRHP